MRFYSKRNEVFLRDGLVHKRVATADAAAQEAQILRALHARGVAVPQVIHCRKELLLLEKLSGEPLPDWIERGGYDPVALANALCDWFAAFYQASPEEALRGDVNGRNFLYDGSIIRSVDFEARSYGPKARDAGRLAAFITTYDTAEPDLQGRLALHFLKEFIVRFGCNTENIAEEYKLERIAMRKRRGG